jgi:hypothetical protein
MVGYRRLTGTIGVTGRPDRDQSPVRRGRRHLIIPVAGLEEVRRMILAAGSSYGGRLVGEGAFETARIEARVAREGVDTGGLHHSRDRARRCRQLYQGMLSWAGGDRANPLAWTAGAAASRPAARPATRLTGGTGASGDRGITGGTEGWNDHECDEQPGARTPDCACDMSTATI